MKGNVLARLFHTKRTLGLAMALVLLAASSISASAAEVEVVVVQPLDVMAWHYEPANLTVSVGTTVTWLNQGHTSVTVTSPDGLFDSEQIPPGGSYSLIFYAPGRYRYFCVPYPHMKGNVTVTSDGGSSTSPR